MERFVRVLAVFFWVAATLFVALLFTAGLSYDFVVGLLGSERLETVLGGLAGDSSGLLRPHRVARVPGEPRGGNYVRAGDGEGSLLRYHLLDRPIPVLLLRPGGVLRPLSFATVLFYSPNLVEGEFLEVHIHYRA